MRRGQRLHAFSEDNLGGIYIPVLRRVGSAFMVLVHWIKLSFTRLSLAEILVLHMRSNASRALWVGVLSNTPKYLSKTTYVDMYRTLTGQSDFRNSRQSKKIIIRQLNVIIE